MTTHQCAFAPIRQGPILVLLALALSLFASRASTVWTGPNITWTKSGATPSDTILAGKVVLTRGSSLPLFNTAAGESSGGGPSSPANTEWAFGTLANFSTLTYQSMASLRNGNLSARIVNQNMVVHIISEDIYFSIRFTAWGMHGSGSVSYSRSTPAAVAPTPTATITAPAAGAVFAAPAAITLTANAAVSAGSVTNVEYFAGATSLGHATSSPFTVIGTLPNAGTFSLTAVATAAGVKGTSAPVSITVVAPIDVSLTAPAINNGNFTFSYSANPGLRYLVERSSDLSSLANWVPVVTNAAAANPATFSETFSAAAPARYFRVGRMPNP